MAGTTTTSTSTAGAGAPGVVHRLAVQVLPRLADPWAGERARAEHEAAAAARATRRRPELQGLRGAAVLLVVLGSAGVPFVRPAVGVHAFLVLTGFLLTRVVVRRVARDDELSLVALYADRTKRLLPVAVLVLLSTAFAGSRLLGHRQEDRLLGDVQWALGATNWQLALNGTGTGPVATATASAVEHFWFLGVVAQFALVWPLLVGGMLLGLRSDRVRGLSAARRWVLSGVVGAVVLGSGAWAVHQAGTTPTTAYWSTLTRLWEPAAGALLAVAWPLVRRLPGPVRELLGWAGLGALVAALLPQVQSSGLPDATAVLPVLGVVAVLAAGRGGPRHGVQRVLSSEPLTRLGDASYALYLWHWPVLVLGAVALGRPSLPVWANLLLLVGAGLLAAATRRWVEDPVRHLAYFRDKPREALLLWPLTAVVLLLPVLYLHTQAVAGAVR